MGLVGGEREFDRSAFSIDDSRDLGGQTAAGMSHAAIVNIPLCPVGLKRFMIRSRRRIG